MRFKILRRQDSVLVFDGDSIDYIASCQVLLYGDVGIMYNINGRQFYELMAEQGEQVLRELGVTSLQGYVVEAHARLLRIALRKVATVTVLHKGMMVDTEMLWVVVAPKAK